MPPRSATVEVDSLAAFDALVSGGAEDMRGWRVQDVDLRGRAEVLHRLDPRGSAFFGCPLDDETAAVLRSGGALLFPPIPQVPFDAYPGALYTPEMLYDRLADGGTYEECLDGRVYAWTQVSDTGDRSLTVARALHDHLIEDALDEALASSPGPAVGVMGGHRVERGSTDYAEAARLGRSLARSGRTVVTGGGPGAMEAANLGAYLATAADDALDGAIERLSAVPSFLPSRTAWARSAFAVRHEHPEGADSVGIPTWFYGHEPPNLFASTIAKYFQNALRESVLTQRCSDGIVFLPGAAGTVQEVFADACENYYAAPGQAAPMVLYGGSYWRRQLPVWPVLRALSVDREMGRGLHVVDSVEDAVRALDANMSQRGG